MTCLFHSSRGVAAIVAAGLALGAPALAETFDADRLVIDRHIGRIEIVTSPTATHIEVQIDPGAGILDAPTGSGSERIFLRYPEYS